MISYDVKLPLKCPGEEKSKSEIFWKRVSGILATVVAGLGATLLYLALERNESFFCWHWGTATSPRTGYIWCKDFDPETAPLHKYLPCSSLKLIEEAYNTPLMQGIKTGELHPKDYARYDLQDWSYLANAAEVYGVVCKTHECDSDLKEFFKNMTKSFQGLADGYVPDYSLVPGSLPHDVLTIADATKDYNKFEKTTSAENKNSKYTAVIMAPCLQLWAMLADQMEADGAPKKGNAYYFWIEENAGYVSESLNRILNNEKDIDWDRALEIYQEGLRKEIGMFKWAPRKKREENWKLGHG